MLAAPRFEYAVDAVLVADEQKEGHFLECGVGSQIGNLITTIDQLGLVNGAD